MKCECIFEQVFVTIDSVIESIQFINEVITIVSSLCTLLLSNNVNNNLLQPYIRASHFATVTMHWYFTLQKSIHFNYKRTIKYCKLNFELSQ